MGRKDPAIHLPTLDSRQTEGSRLVRHRIRAVSDLCFHTPRRSNKRRLQQVYLSLHCVSRITAVWQPGVQDTDREPRKNSGGMHVFIVC